MTSKAKSSKIELEIEKYRSTSNWTKLNDYSKQINSRDTQIEVVVEFLQVESNVEKYLSENPATDENVEKSKRELLSSSKKLKNITRNHSLKDLYILPAKLLLAKVWYAMGDYSSPLQIYDEIALESISVSGVPNRRLQLVGEAFAIKGLCLEKPLSNTSASSDRKAREEQIIRCFEKAGDMSLVYLQNQQVRATDSGLSVATKGAGIVEDQKVVVLGPAVETAIQRSPIYHIRNGDVSRGLGRFRELLRATDTTVFQGLKQTLARQLAEVLLRGVCLRSYEPVERRQDSNTSKKPTPKRHQGSGGAFCPNNPPEETLLLLLISECIASREALLNRSEEFTDARLHRFHGATAVYDLLAITLVRYSQFNMLSEAFEHSMKFSFDEFHIWYQFALSLVSSEKYSNAYLVLQECIRMEERNVVVLLQTAKLCYERLNLYSDGVQYCMRALDVEENPMVSRSYMYLGVGHCFLAEEAHVAHDRKDLQRKALKALSRAVHIDQRDYLARFHFARQLAECKQISEAMKQVRCALRLQPDHLHSHHLLAHLLSASKLHQAALHHITTVLDEYPDDFNLLFSKSLLEQAVHGTAMALQTCKDMLGLWKRTCEPHLNNEVRGTGLLTKVTNSNRNLMTIRLTDLSERETGSVKNDSVTAIELTLSDVASSLGSRHAVSQQAPSHHWGLQIRLWLHLADLYLEAENVVSAQCCVNEAASIHPLAHTISYMRGRIHDIKGEVQEARRCYENAVAVNPQHTKSLEHLGVLLYRDRKLRMAEKALRMGVHVEPTSAELWSTLGNVLQELNDTETAANCHMTAMDLEATASLIPLSAISKIMVG